LRWRKVPASFPGNNHANRQIGAVMSVYALDVIFWIVGIRGHIPQPDDFGASRGGSSLADSGSPLLRMLFGLLVSTAVLALALWAAVWLALKLL
jgi:hypothetical protein